MSSCKWVLLVLAGLPVAGASAQNLSAALAKMDAANAKFTSAQADVKKDEFTRLLGDHDLSKGSVYFVRTGKGTEAGITIDGMNARTASYKDGHLQVFNPKTHCYDAIDASKNKGKVDSFLTLGFGGSGKDLANAWDIKDLGPEMVEGVNTEKLELISKDQGVRNTYTKVTLWMDLDRDVSIKQFFVTPEGNTNTAIYSNIRLNEKVNTKPFEFKGGVCKAK